MLMIEALHDRMMAMQEFNALNADQQQELRQVFEEKLNEVNNQRLIAACGTSHAALRVSNIHACWKKWNAGTALRMGVQIIKNLRLGGRIKSLKQPTFLSELFL